MQRDGANKSLWQFQTPAYKPENEADLSVIYDVVIAGAGITGISTALRLQEAGKKCLVVESFTPCFGTTGGTTAHLNTLLDVPYTRIASNFGDEAAAMIAQASKGAVDQIEGRVKALNIDCGFERKEAFLFAQNGEQEKELDEIAEATATAGVQNSPAAEIPLPIPFTKAIRVPGQGQFHPARYVYALAHAFEQAGGVIKTGCRVEGTEEKEVLEVRTSAGIICCRKLIYATHIPPGMNILHLRCAPYRSYAIALRLASGEYPPALAYDMYDPYHYFRTQRVEGKEYLIIGGYDHKTGHEESAREIFGQLEAYAREQFDVAEVSFRWSSQYFEPADGLPYIGHMPGSSENVLVATGFGGNGMTYGTIASGLLADIILGNNNQLIKLLSPARVKPVAGFASMVSENADVAAEFVSARFRSSRPICTHLKCSVHWNDAEQSWDCPCHGARFNKDGRVLTGPADRDLSATC